MPCDSSLKLCLEPLSTLSFMFVVLIYSLKLLYLSGLNMMEGILTKPKEAKLKIMGGDFIWS